MRGQSLVLSKKGKLEKKHLFYLRSYRQGDERGIIECVRDEYGDTYFKQWFYEEEAIIKKVETGSITLLVAEHFEGTNGKREIAGLMILKEERPCKTMCEVASLIFKKKYRGYGLSKGFFEYGLKVLNGGDYSAALCLPVLFHDVSQRLLYDKGLRATGLVLNVLDTSHITHSYDNGRNQKHSQGVQVAAKKKNKAGMLYIPREFQSICKMIYKELKVEFQLSTEKKKNKMPERTILSSFLDKKQNSLTVEVNTIGKDFGKVLKKIQKAYPLNEKRTANVFMNCNDKHAIWAWRKMENKGWFFTGLLPLCSEREYMIFHNPGEVDIYFEDYELSTEFAQLTVYISAEYERSRVRVKKGER